MTDLTYLVNTTERCRNKTKKILDVFFSFNNRLHPFSLSDLTFFQYSHKSLQL